MHEVLTEISELYNRRKKGSNAMMNVLKQYFLTLIQDEKDHMQWNAYWNDDSDL